MPKTLSTADVPARQKATFWTEAISSTFVSLECTATSRESIDGDITIQTLPSLEVSRVRGSGQTVARLRSGITGDASESFYLLGVQTRGACVVRQDGRATKISNRDFALYDTLRPYTLELTDDFEQFVIRLPRAAMMRHQPEIDLLTAVGIDAQRGPGAVLVATLGALIQDSDVLSPAAAYALAQGIEHLIVAGLEQAPRTRLGTVTTPRRSLIRQYILANLRDPELDIPAIATGLHLSPSSIHRAFADGGQTVMSWMWQQRLNGAHRDLVEGNHAGSLTELAYAWGFSSSAHFSRVFRRHFGAPPSYFRPGGNRPDHHDTSSSSI